MPGKHKFVQCPMCSQVKRSDNIKRHLRLHGSQGSGVDLPPTGELHDELPTGASLVTDKYTWRDKGVIRNHSPLFPRDIRGILIGKSGVGKTTLLTHLLLEPDMLDYDTLTICGKSLHQPEYKVMRSAFDKNLSKSQVANLFEYQDGLDEYGDIDGFLEQYDGDCKGGIEAVFNDDVNTIPDPSALDPERKNLIIFDDIMLGPQSTPEKYYTRGRHNGVDAFYIAQSYFPLPRSTVRENANIFFFFKQDNKNLTHIFQDHSAVDGIPLDVFINFCNAVWNEDRQNFVTIDSTRPTNNGKYRKNLSEFWTPPGYRDDDVQESEIPEV